MKCAVEVSGDCSLPGSRALLMALRAERAA
jgi:hypothetical protein